MSRILAVILMALIPIGGASAQQLQIPVVSACGTPPQTYSAGGSYLMTQDTTGKLCTNATAGGPAAISGAVPVVLTSQYPANATTPTPIPETISATATTASFTATLAAASGKTTFICGFEVDAEATAGTVVTMTVTGTITGTLNFLEYVTTLAGVGNGQNVHTFSPCIPASATNTTIVVNAGAAGSGGVASASAWGYQL